MKRPYIQPTSQTVVFSMRTNVMLTGSGVYDANATGDALSRRGWVDDWDDDEFDD